LEVLMQTFLNTLQVLTSSRATEEGLLYASLGFVLMLGAYFCYFTYLTMLSQKIWLTQGLVCILPFNTVLLNDRLYEEIAKWKEG
jgi:hypothetical protein